MNETSAGFFARLRQRKLVQWALAYIAAAFALIQVIDVVASRFDWPAQLERIIILALAVGFVVTLVIAWYHGEKGRQRASGAELLLIALVLAIGGALVWQFGRVSRSPDVAQRNRGSLPRISSPARLHPGYGLQMNRAVRKPFRSPRNPWRCCRSST